jgi:hypothetical protein
MTVRQCTGRACLGLATGALLLASQSAGVGAAAGAIGTEGSQFRVVVSIRMLTEVNASDAKAAMRAWVEALARERGIHAEPDPQVADGVDALARVLAAGKYDLVSMPTDEFVALAIKPEPTTFLVGYSNGVPTEEYLLLVRQDAGFSSLAELAGRSVLVLDHPRATLAAQWLDTILLEGGLSPAKLHFARVNQGKKLAGVLLPVFFGQADACVVPRHGYEVMSELNPQVGRQMRPLADSPDLYPSVAYAQPRTDGSLPGLDLLREIRQLPSTAAGQQILRLCQADSLGAVPASAVDETRRLLAAHQRLLGEWERKAGRRQVAAAGAAIPGRAITPVNVSGGGGR